MRLHRLEIEGFGPFGGHEQVDFDALASGGLFLLSGPTGAGKTSVLDAVCFALFGEVPGARGDAGRLASDHRAPDVRPRVALEATVGGRRIRVARTPAHLRPRKRGGEEGDLVQEPAAATLELQGPDGEWKAVAGKLQDVAHELDPLLGMTAEQFLQVVMLPQGAFATFLRADAKQRQAVLERLFDAGRYSRIEQWLKDRAGEARGALDRARIAADNAFAEAGGAWGAPTPAPLLRERATADELTGWLAAERERLAADAAAAATARERAIDARRNAESDREQARELAEHQTRRREAEARLQAIEAEADGHEQRVARLEAHRRAVPLRGYLDAVRQATARAQDGERTLAKARAWVTQLEDPTLSPDDPTTWAAGARRRADDAAGLRELVALEEGLAGRTSELERRRTAAAEAARAAAEADERLAAAEAEAKALDDRRRAAGEAAQHAAALAEQAAAATTAAAAGERRDALAARATAADDALRAAVDAHQAAAERVLELRARRLEGYAAELAAGLGDDEPCPVCGSPDHPAPAAGGDGHVTAEEEQAAATAADAARAAREQAERQRHALHAELAAAEQAAGGEPTPALRERAAELERRLGVARTAAEDDARIAAEREALEQRTAADRRTQQQAREQATAEATRADALEAELTRLRERLAHERDGFPDVAARVRALRHDATYLEKASGAHQDDLAARTAREEADRALAAALRDHGIAGDEQAIAALQTAIVTPREADELAAAIEQVERARTAARAMLALPEVAAVAGTAPVDVVAAEQRRTAAAEEAERATTAAAAAAARVAALDDREPRLRAQLDELAPLVAAADRAHELAELARGGAGNRRRIQLSSWVLAARLEQVADAATVHLQRMSAGRYALVLHEEPATARGKGNAGLGLRVLDGWTGEQRDTTTLSGGESFFASLALALGLAEVVSAEAGGLDLGTLFIDEGFGTLDEQTLDEVLGVLDGLRDGGRAVGIVSHVPELKQRIPIQLVVEKRRDGSQLRQQAAAAL
ncbi:SMC family ATPase [Patulibacter defluvii]|uniref:SMC family ATPase n=1 Tax=Patulibacter defluvii TaxID=3095358 RepID=UPI002A75FB9D|nr:SMC family ATPase [Patulibacter sp. DM4]